MNSGWTRWNIILMFVMVHAAFITTISQVTNKYLHDTTPVIHQLRLDRVARLRTERQRDRAILLFDFDLDLSKVFDWNCKQIFLFIEISYKAPNRPINRAIIWDDTILTKDHAKRIKGEKVFSDYEMDDIGQHLRGAEFNLSIGYDVMPYIGFLGKHHQLKFDPGVAYKMPSGYGTNM